MIKPRLYLDIDGVVNIFPAKHGNPNKKPHLRAWKNWKTFTVKAFHDGKEREFIITWSPDLMAELIALTEIYDIYWLTNWRHTALTQFAPQTGLPEFPVCDELGIEDGSYLSAVSLTGHPHKRWWKINAIVKDMEENPDLKWVWIDDSIRPAIRTYFKSLARLIGFSHMLITPFDAIGITPEHIQKLRDFALAA
ncbi:MAG: hypothetical protein H9W81_01085 [Enterococcus sp.]|nr:hypothetical protein [Enterococcus sp.]